VDTLAEKRTVVEKRDYIRDRRPRGLSIAKGCRADGDLALDLLRCAAGESRRHRDLANGFGWKSFWPEIDVRQSMLHLEIDSIVCTEVGFRRRRGKP
jgi:hypothetical protein